jgi:hypothetical protein
LEFADVLVNVGQAKFVLARFPIPLWSSVIIIICPTIVMANKILFWLLANWLSWVKPSLSLGSKSTSPSPRTIKWVPVITGEVACDGPASHPGGNACSCLKLQTPGIKSSDSEP